MELGDKAMIYTVIERLARIEEKQDGMAKQLEELTESLFGNGQPGIIQSIIDRVTKLEKDWIRTFSYVGGGAAVLMYILDKVWK